MKFAKELEHDLVPEWRAKYLDYKSGKKQVKKVARAYKDATSSPRLTKIPTSGSIFAHASPRKESISRDPNRLDGTGSEEPFEPLRGSPAGFGAGSCGDIGESSEEPAENGASHPIGIPKSKEAMSEISMNYGSFVPTPSLNSKAGPLSLPDPAISSDPATPVSRKSMFRRTTPVMSSSLQRGILEADVNSNAYEVGKSTSPNRSSWAPIKGTPPNAAASHQRQPSGQSPRNLLQRVLSTSSPMAKNNTRNSDFNMAAYDAVKTSQKEFFKFMDSELKKVEDFYEMKEQQAGERLRIIRDQLHEMRDRRVEEVTAAQRARDERKDGDRSTFDIIGFGKTNGHKLEDENTRESSWRRPLDKVMGVPGPNSKALQKLTGTPRMSINENLHRFDRNRDYTRKPTHDQEVTYRSAKRKLKLALQEFYRGMELLKSYAILNRTAFRKLNKKYDKACNAHPPLRYMNEKVNKAWFVKSEVLDQHIHVVEDLYARYFERGNHKLAVGKLRSSTGRAGHYPGCVFSNGIMIGIGAVFLIQGIIYASALLHNADPVIQTQTGYLLQIYGGYSLALYLFSLFCVDCYIWTIHKINYQFIFEFDTRHNLDWRELSQFPSFLVLLLGVFVWINFSGYGTPEMFIYYPVILIFTTAVIIFIPAPILFHRSRKWFIYSHWRLLLAGLYPVEFRDFFLGDMYCSLTYFMSNIELFFCLYAHYWNNPTQCNSTHSRLLGFFTTLPGIWRALQCIRRYYDTRDVFPHLVNCGKYGMTIMYYITLSLFRINRADGLLALFITFAALNAIYVSIWDLCMDWSLCQPHAKVRYLRNVRGFKHAWWYYTAMVIDPILRFNWIFYIVYTHDLQHSSIASFLIAFSEVTRRGMWTLFRVENEHCTNVGRFRASRDVPLPYEISSPPTPIPEEEADISTAQTSSFDPVLTRRRTGTLEGGQTTVDEGSNIRQRGPGARFTEILANAHWKDFEKKRKPGVEDSEDAKDDEEDEERSSDEDAMSAGDERDAEDTIVAEDLIRRHTSRRRDS